MAKVASSFKSFVSGEITPRLHARFDLPLYHSALRKCLNFNITPQGSALMRRGWNHIGNAASNEYVRLMTFARSLDEDIILELSEGNIRAFNTQGEIIVDLDSPSGGADQLEYELVNDGNFNFGLSSWDVNYVNTTNGTDPRPAYVSGGWYTSNAFSAFNGSSREHNSIRQTLTKPVTTGINDFLDIQFAVKYDSAEFSGTRFNVSSYITSFKWDAVVYEADGTTVIQALTSQTSTGVKSFSSIDMTSRTSVVVEFKAHLGTGVPPAADIFGAQFTDIRGKYTIELQSPAAGSYPWTKAQIPEIRTQVLTGQDSMIMVQEDVPPHVLTFDSTTGRLRLSEVVFTVGTSPAWDGTTGYPSAVEIFQGRLWMAATTSEPNSIWASKSGEPYNFDYLDTPSDSTALYLPLATRGSVKWMLGQSDTMAVGTDLGEYVLESTGPIITGSDASAVQSSAYGSSDLSAIPYGNQILYVTADSRKLLAINYEDRVQNWVATDLTWIAEHLTEAYIQDFHSLRAPDYQLVVLNRDGSWLQCTYDNVAGVLGWQRHETRGEVVSITSSRSANGDILWAAINRNGKIFINRMEPSTFQRHHLDSWVRRYVQEDVNGWFIDDLEHLAGLPVEVIQDGSLSPTGTVDEFGVLRLTRNSSEVIVGLTYKGTIVTLPEEPSGGNDTYSGSKKRNSNIYVRLANSAMPLVNGERPADRSAATAMGNRELNKSKDINVRSLGWTDQGEIDITQDLPLRTEIVGIFTKLGVNKT